MHIRDPSPLPCGMASEGREMVYVMLSRVIVSF